MLTGDNRRKEIMEILRQEKRPMPGADLARRLGVSRQVIVQDIALLRTACDSIISTNRGYLLYE